MDTYVKSISGDFGGNLDIGDLQETIQESSIVPTVYITTLGDVVTIKFSAALSPAEETILNIIFSTYVFYPKIDDRTFNIVRTIDPTPNDDIRYGYIVGSRWTNTTTNQVFVCLSATKTAAKWKNTSNKGYDAIVDASGKGDYLKPSEAFAAGATSVFLRPGVYLEFQDIVPPDEGIMVGEGPARAIIAFAGPYSIKVDATLGVKETAGTISVANGTKTITGVGTTFTNLVKGQFILLGQTPYEIDIVNSDTEMLILTNYIGKDLVNASYQAHSLYSGVYMYNFIIGQSYSYGLHVRGTRHSVFSSIAAVNCVTSFRFDDSFSDSISNMATQETSSHGVVVHDSFTLGFHNVTCFQAGGNGFVVSGISDCIIISDCQGSNNSNHGFHVTDTATETEIRGCIAKFNGSDGVCIDANVDRCNIIDCTIVDNGANGTTLIGPTTTIQGSSIGKNTLNGIVSNNDSIITVNQVFENGECGIVVNGTENEVIGNRVFENLDHGICGTGNSNIVSNNLVRLNQNDGINISGAENSINNNRIRNNGAYGIGLTGAASYTILNANNIKGHVAGIYVSPSINSCIIGLNLVSGASTSGIVNESDISLIVGNLCRGNTQYGVHNTTNANSTFLLANHLAGNGLGPDLDEGAFPVLTPIKGSYIAKDYPIPVSGLTSNASYTTISTYIYAGSFNNHKPISFLAATYMDIGATDYSIRIYDLTHSLQLAELTGLTNTSSSIVTLSSVTNVPTAASILAIQMKINNLSAENCYIDALLVKYY